MKWAAFLLATLPGLYSPVPTWGHAGAFILAKCAPDPSGMVTLELTVDFSQHPLLKDRGTALAALRNVLQLESLAGPAALDTLGGGKVTDPSLPDSNLPFPSDPGDKNRPHQLVGLAYTWQPPGGEIKFSVPATNPHDVLFWLTGNASPPGDPVPWRVLIAGDQTPPIPILKQQLKIPPRPAGPALLRRIASAFGIVGFLVSLVIWRARKTWK